MEKKDISTLKWNQFDVEWYRKRYSSVLPMIDDVYAGDVYAYYKVKGKKIGHSPNPFFDEKWYLLTYPDVEQAIQDKKFQSGFEHYCQEGYSDRSPHWLFSATYYQELYKEKTNNFSGYQNGYDHYLSEGDQSLYSGSFFFNPTLYVLQHSSLDEMNADGGPYKSFLKKSIFQNNNLKTSWLFDEEWYFNTYPEVQSLVTRHVYQSGLHHYLSNETPWQFSPLADFSESFYNENYADVASSIGARQELRSGYIHFMLYGFQEGRKANSTLDLEQYKQQDNVIRAISDHLFYNAFECWVAQKHQVLFKQYCNDFGAKYFVETAQEPIVALQEPANVETAQEPIVALQEPANVETAQEPIVALQEPANVETAQESLIIYQEPDIIEVAQEPASVPHEKSDLSRSKDHNINLSERFPIFIVDEDPSLFIADTEEEKIQFIESEEKKNLDDSEGDDKNPHAKFLDDNGKISAVGAHQALWKVFDEEWYVRRYSEVTSEMKALEIDSIEEYYHAFGCYLGHSPNPYFDEEWYLKTYPAVKKMINERQYQYASGFDHYCQLGYCSYSPHWLFSEKYYREQNVHLTNELLLSNGFVNGYDHYLHAGDKEGLSGSPFFDPDYFVGHYDDYIQHDLGAYSHYLKNIMTIDGTTKTSWYFDPGWYLQTYPEVIKLIDEHKFINALHHYLTNDTPKEYSPLFWFDEQFYDIEHERLLKEQENNRKYRNGYFHFIDQGIDLLWQSSPYFYLGAYSLKKDVKQDMCKGLYPNSFIHWLANHIDISSLENMTDNEITEYTTINDNFDNDKVYEGALWAQFDEDWYLSIYSDTKEKMEVCGISSVKEYYEQVGGYLLQSPNAYFDEEWYVNHYESVQKAIKRGIFKTGFEHYCNVGFKNFQPHWLFSPDYYMYHNSQFSYEINSSEEYINAYDHYLKKGDALRKTGSIFFDPLVYERYCYESGDVEKTFFPFRNYLLNISKADRKATVSLYFDTGWYLERYPEVLKKIQAREVSSAIEHYLLNATPTLFDPLPWFSEKFYFESYPDLAGAVLEDGNGTFRNGYEHFIAHGSLECRNPHPDVNLRDYFLSGSVQEDIENGIYRDAFAHWIFDKRLEAWVNNLPEDSHYRLNKKTIESRAYFRKKAHFMLPTVAHQKLDFSYEGKPDISVVMLVKNQLAVTLTALSSLRANFKGNIQLLLGDNYSTDDTRFVQNSLMGAHITKFSYNFGYGRACNYLIERVEAPITIFLNNDIYLYPGALDILCQHLVSKADIGAVGGKIIHPDGNLQEAGSIIWRDGTTTGYLRGKDPLIAEANFVRDVDYCSTAMMAIKTTLLQQLKGFSPIYYPAYFEDTDLCVRILKAGYRVVYHPDAVVEHMEYASSDPIVSSGLIRRNHRKFAQTHNDFLRFQHPRHSDNMIIARQRGGNGKRILFIEDRIPLRRLGSGYVRSNDIISQMSKLGYNVTVYPINSNYPHIYQIYSDLPETVEILYDKTIDHIRDFFFERAGYYDMVWIGRTHNLNRILPMMGEANRYLPQDCLVLDTEVIAAPRTLLREKILGINNENKETLDEALEVELSCARHCQTMVTVNEIDAEYARQIGFDQVSILGHMMSVRATPKTWEQRADLLFIGALHDDLSPNFDSLQWFVKAVLPILVEKMGDKFSLTIAGYVHPSVDMSVFAQYPQLKLLGPIEDLTYLYNNHRVYIAPTRFAGGIPHKLHEAASFGIPIVATELLVNQLGWEDDIDILAASIDNPVFFASQIIRLYHEEELWNKLRKNALSRIDKECSEEQFRDNLQQILTHVASRK